MSEEKKDFTVKDRRIFSGEEKEEAEAEDLKKESAEKETKVKASEPETKETVKDEIAGQDDIESETQLPEINFSTFIFSLNASALVNLGAIENPATGKKEKNLPLAKQTIDILGMLEEKTGGNLSSDEENLLKNILYDLRLSYVKEKQ